MKIRSRFVSNSSSSSFIVGIAKVIDVDKLKTYLSAKGFDLDKSNGYECFVTTFGEIKDNKRYSVKIVGGTVEVDSFQDSVSLKSSLKSSRLKDDDQLFIVNVSNDEGDGAFWDEEREELDYDIVDLGWFNEQQQAMYNAFADPESGLDTDKSMVTYGAARNG
jgi:hypothetical protein